MKNEVILVDNNYLSFLDAIKSQVQNSRLRLTKTANRELISLYWWLGSQIVENQEKHSWGKSIVEQLSKDLSKTFAFRVGFSARNLWDMRKFYLEYKDEPNLRQLVAEIPWGHNLLIISKVKETAAREYYLKAALDMGWSRNVLMTQIKSNSYQRHRLVDKQHNFAKALPRHLAEQANEAMKDVYMLDMFGITRPILETELEARIVSKIKDVMLELGYGFAFIGNQYRIVENGKEYFIDLLFFNRLLRCLVAMELKVGEFRPEYAGKMNFYLNLLDDFVREKDENPSIGIILCAERDRFEVEYALRGIEKPIGVSEFRLTKELPAELSDMLPDPKEIEETIKREIAISD